MTNVGIWETDWTARGKYAMTAAIPPPGAKGVSYVMNAMCLSNIAVPERNILVEL
jgi:hypothetical protein